MYRKRKEKKRGIQGILWKNYVFMVFLSSILILIPFYLILLFSDFYKENLAVEKYSAASLLEEDSRKNLAEENHPDAVWTLTRTETFSRILDSRGGVQVVSEDLKVQDLGGLSLIKKQDFTMEEWTEFLKNLDYRQDGYSYSVAYREGTGWVVVEFPVSILFVLSMDSNSDSVDFPLMCTTLAGIIFLYLLLLGFSAVIYARRTARSLVWPMKQLCQAMQCFKEGKAANRPAWNSAVPRELTELCDDFFEMQGQLLKKEEEKQQLSENRKRLVRDISHDLKNPLAGVLGYAELLRKKEVPEETRQEYISIIYQNSQRADRLIQSLFEYSKLESADFLLKKKQEDLCELLRLKLVEFFPLFEEKGFLLEAEIPEEEILFLVDAFLFGRIFDNLLENALRYNKAGTTVRVRLEKVLEAGIHIQVSDDGTGMEEAFAATVFDAFSREENAARNSEKGGSGLGLAIVRQIVELHGGTITLRTKKGEGSCFEIYCNESTGTIKEGEKEL